MKVGVQINRFDFPGGTSRISEHLKNIAEAAEAADFDSLWVMDHFFQLPTIGDYSDPMLEAYDTLGYLAGITKKVTLGTMVTGVIYREPAVLINAVTSLDVLSGGRAYFGIGAGWNEQEAKALGLLDPLHSQRFDRLEDTLQLALQMWSDDQKPFKGKIYNLPEPLLRPLSVTKPHPPILIGGGGEQKTLRLVAQYGDACNLFARDMPKIEHKMEVLKQYCKEYGRSFEAIEKTVLVGRNVTDALQDINETMTLIDTLAGKGISHVIFSNNKDADPDSYTKFATHVQKIHDL